MLNLCLYCRAILPAGAVFCSCGRTPGSRVCDARHVSPPYVSACTTCGSRVLTEPAAVLPLGWLFSIVALVVIVVAVHLLVFNARDLEGGLGWLLNVAAIHVFGMPAGCLVARAVNLAIMLAIAYGLCGLLPQPMARNARAGMVWIARRGLWACGRLIVLVCRLVWRLVVPAEAPSGRATGRKK